MLRDGQREGALAGDSPHRDCHFKPYAHKGDDGDAVHAPFKPLWPHPWYGSISHCERSALAVVSVRPIGVDIERILTPDENV